MALETITMHCGYMEWCTQNIITHQPLEKHRRQFEDDILTIDWDSDEHMSSVWNGLALIKKGCGCKTAYNANWCKCRRNNVHCGPGFICDICANHSASKQISVVLYEESDNDECNSGDELDDERV